MNEVVLRVLAVGMVVAVALMLIWWLRRRAERIGPPVPVAGLVSGRSAVVFTKDDCRTCGQTLDRLRSLNIPVVQVRAEERPDELEQRGVTGVPVTVVVDDELQPCGQFRGLPPGRALRRAVRRAAKIPDRRAGPL